MNMFPNKGLEKTKEIEPGLSWITQLFVLCFFLFPLSIPNMFPNMGAQTQTREIGPGLFWPSLNHTKPIMYICMFFFVIYIFISIYTYSRASRGRKFQDLPIARPSCAYRMTVEQIPRGEFSFVVDYTATLLVQERFLLWKNMTLCHATLCCKSRFKPSRSQA